MHPVGSLPVRSSFHVCLTFPTRRKSRAVTHGETWRSLWWMVGTWLQAPGVQPQARYRHVTLVVSPHLEVGSLQYPHDRALGVGGIERVDAGPELGTVMQFLSGVLCVVVAAVWANSATENTNKGGMAPGLC